jgi:hypothetical protein
MRCHLGFLVVYNDRRLKAALTSSSVRSQALGWYRLGPGSGAWCFAAIGERPSDHLSRQVSGVWGPAGASPAARPFASAGRLRNLGEACRWSGLDDERDNRPLAGGTRR